MTFKLNKNILQRAKFLHKPEGDREIDTYDTLPVSPNGFVP